MGVLRKRGLLTKDAYLLILDCDGVAALLGPHTLLNVIQEAPLNWVSLSAVTDPYYDIWALRSPWIDHDCWEAVSLGALWKSVSSSSYSDYHFVRDAGSCSSANAIFLSFLKGDMYKEPKPLVDTKPHFSTYLAIALLVVGLTTYFTVAFGKLEASSGLTRAMRGTLHIGGFVLIMLLVAFVFWLSKAW